MNKRPKILYLQHRVQDTGPLLEILEELSPAYQYLAVRTLEEYVNLLQDYRPDIILCDEDLEIISAKEALLILQMQEADVAFLIICAESREDEALELLKSGASDYVISEKPQRLFYALYNQAERLRALNKLEQATREKERLYKRNLADTTALKIREKHVFRSKESLSVLFDHSETAYVMASEDLKVIFFNLPAQKLTENFRNPPMAAGCDIMSYFPVHRKPDIAGIIHRVMEGEEVSYHVTLRDRYGNDCWFSVRWIRADSEEKTERGFILSLRDITASKSTSLAMAQSNADLVKRNRSLEQFTYIVSHNLLAPVNNILALTELMKDTQDGEREILIDGLQSSIKTMDTIIKDLNHTLQIKDQVNKKKEEVHFRQLVEEITFSINNLMIAEKVTISCDFEAMQSLYTVRGYLYSVFYNLTLNSIKYRRPEAFPVIHIQSALVKDQLVLTFQDNGKGIDMQKNGQHLFSLYKRFDTTTEGKGMGMFMVKTQIEELNGSIQVESQLGQGTKIKISLPLTLS